MAWLVVRAKMPGARWWAAGCSLPLAMPSFVAALSLLGAFGTKGFLQQILEPLGVDRLPDIHGLAGATIALVMATFPYVFLLTVAALRSIDPSVEEAARSLGRRPVGVFFTVTFPQIRRAVAGGTLISGLYVISDYGAVDLMRYDTLTRAIFTRYKTRPTAPRRRCLGICSRLTVLFLVLGAAGAWRTGLLSARSGLGHATALGAPRPLDLGGARVLGHHGRVVRGHSGCGARLLVRARRANDQRFEVPWQPQRTHCWSPWSPR